ncbi:30S ribosomal protein S11 [Candidatus Peregrinibacteria bacterium]|jgi:small subunit ribosomal protein S11|nr:30S ribosomal protein S11 [Candidatus Peregrinibacteria bacterium]
MATAKKKVKRRIVTEGRVYINATYNNTLVTITDAEGDTLSWGSSGSSGFKGTRKSTPYAAQVAAEAAVERAKPYGLQKVRVFVKGVGTGRDQGIRGLIAGGLELISIEDLTSLPHNGCRRKGARRV